MAVESATTINQLDQTKPGINDLKSEGDDHIRLLKSTIKNTLPNLTGPVTATQAELNRVAGVTSPLQTQIDALSTSKANIASPAFTGTPTAPTATAGTSTTQLATTAFVTATAFAPVLPGQAGNAGGVLGTDGANANWQIRSDFQEFLTSGTWIKPSNVSFVYVEAIGGGGSGASNTSTNAAGGASGGEFVSGIFRASDVAASVTVTVGAGGAAVAVTGPGNAGGSSVFNGHVTALGGNPGVINNGYFATVPRCRVAILSSVGSVIHTGLFNPFSGYGGPGANDGNGAGGGNAIYGGAGGTGVGATTDSGFNGTSLFGGNGGAGALSGTATSGAQPGGGGGGCNGGGTSGAGGAGRVRVWAW